jgi:uncharacterized membrane protein
MHAFVRLTLIVAAVLTALFLVALVLKVIVAAVFIAALLVGGLFAVNFVRGFCSRRQARLTGTVQVMR